MSEKKPKILMIEDDRFLRKIYHDKFTTAGFEFVEATNGVEGTNKVMAEKPDLVLLDLILPRKNGFDVLVDIKRTEATKKIPVIILSNLAQRTDKERALELGANDYLVKAEVSLSDVVGRAKEWLVKK